MKFDLIAVMPVYNEEDCIENVLTLWIKALSKLNISYRILAINDGSKDKTSQALGKFGDNDNVQIINKSNSGHGPTILFGYRLAVKDAEWVFQCDSDNEMDPCHFKTLWERRDQFDALFGFRAGRKQNFGRKIITLISRLAVRLFFGAGVRDVNTPYRLIRSELLEKIIKRIPDNTFAPNIIISGCIARSGARIFQIPVPHQSRKTGQVSIVKWKLWKSAFKAFQQTISFR